MKVVSDGVAALFEKIGPAVLFTHSQGGGPGWLTAIKSENVKAIVAFEPGSSFIFPEGEVPSPIPSAFDTVEGAAIPLSQFMRLTRFRSSLSTATTFPIAPWTCPPRTAGALG
jgi:hypothetical protein